VVEHAGGIVQNAAVNLAGRNDDLEGVAQGVRGCDESGDDEAEGAPEELRGGLAANNRGRKGRHTAVMVSMQRTKGSEVR
jgi:hypothetical protein